MHDPGDTRTSSQPRRRLPQAAPPARVGRYAIECELGRGGMGVVYRARDTRLDRLVALKSLPRHVALDAAARERFEREARLLAALEHPHVAAIYGIEDTDDGSFLVLQHVEGESLSSRLVSAPLTAAEALDVAAQIASGVAAAHRRGIVHCDLKPANVMVTREGTVKIVDFGIATRWRGSATTRSAEGDESASSGYGTPAYMSPEQIGGVAVDPRTDVWSFACTMLEALTGTPPFFADNPRIVVALIEKTEPSWDALPDDVPPGFVALLQRCLAKDRDHRPKDMDAVARELATLAQHAPAAARAPLPIPLSTFVGRDRELGEISAMLRAGRLVTLTGTAGCGKTRLVLEAARRDAKAWPDGAWFASLAPVADPKLVAATIANAIGVGKEPGSPEAAVLNALRDKQGLLILDNCEHVLSEAARLAEAILAAAPGVHVACTSREALGIAGETAWRVPSLSTNGVSSDAASLFVERAREARPGYEPDEAASKAIAAILERLDGIPLAIELAAARVRMLTPEQILERLSDRFRLLTGGSRNALERHQTLRAALDWSYGLLGDDDKRCLRELSVFAGSFRLEEAAKVSTGDEFEVLDRVSSLVAKSLVQAESDSRSAPRYRLLESIRQHASQKLEEADEAVAARDRHREAYREFLAHVHSSSLRTDAGFLPLIDAERDNVRAALEWALSDPRTTDEALEIAARLNTYWDLAAYWIEGREWIERVLAAPGLPAEGKLLAMLHAGLGRMEYHLGRQQNALDAFRRAQHLYEGAGLEEDVLGARMMAAMIDHQQGRLDAALAVYHEVIERSRALGAMTMTTETLLNACVLERDQAKHDDARRHGEEALAIARQRQDARHEARAMRMLGVVARDEGRLDEADDLIARAIAIHEARGERRDADSTRVELAHVATLKKEYDRAVALHRRILAETKERGDLRGMALSLANIGAIANEQGRPEEARAPMIEALGSARLATNRPLTASILSVLADIVRHGDPELGVEMLGCVDATREEMGRRLAGEELQRWERLVATLREELGDRFGAPWQRGRARKLEDFADDVVRRGAA